MGEYVATGLQHTPHHNARPATRPDGRSCIAAFFSPFDKVSPPATAMPDSETPSRAPAEGTDDPQDHHDEPDTQAGYVALVGVPNVGKSTLMNRLIGQKLSIVTPRAQTTRDRITGIITSEDTQMVFLDTPGLLEPKYLLQRSMREAAMSAAAEADIVLLLLDATRAALSRPKGDALELLLERRQNVVVAINKVDAKNTKAIEKLKTWGREQFGTDVLTVSAATGKGIDKLLAVLTERLPTAHFFYPSEDLAIQPVRFFVSELVRETIFEQYAEEVPYSAVVRVEEFRETEQPIYIRATIFVERGTQKQIIIGSGGSAIRQLGISSRRKIEEFVGEQVYLDLWVKALPRWRKKPSSLRFLGYPVPESKD